MARGKNEFDFLRTKKGINIEDTQNFILKISIINFKEFKEQLTLFLRTADNRALEQLHTLAELVNLKSCCQTNQAQKRFSTEIKKNLLENLNYLESLRKEKQFYVIEKGKVVVWDINGPINHGRPQGDDDCYQPEFRNPKANYGEDPHDFIVANKPFLKLTLDILHANNVKSVIGSQQIQMDECNLLQKAMYKGLDYIFGSNRPYLNENKARKIGLPLQNEKNNKSKNLLLKAYKNEFKVAAESIIFVDDNEIYRKPAEQAGHIFVHASRLGEAGSLADNAYLYETLLRCVPAQKIYDALAKSRENPTQKNEFKKQLLAYQLNNLRRVTLWQSKILAEENLLSLDKGQNKLARNEASAKQLLQGIEFLIRDTHWDIGYLGGEAIVDLHSGKSNTIPKGMYLILKEINKGFNGSNTWTRALSNVEKIVNYSVNKRDHGFFNKRGETSQFFYDRTKEILKEAREQGQTNHKGNSVRSSPFKL